jgi:amino acid transporter
VRVETGSRAGVSLGQQQFERGSTSQPNISIFTFFLCTLFSLCLVSSFTKLLSFLSYLFFFQYFFAAIFHANLASRGFDISHYGKRSSRILVRFSALSTRR